MLRRHFLKKGISVAGFLATAGAIGTLLSTPCEAEPLLKPSKKERCRVCGMFVRKYPKWMAGFVMGSGAVHFHCSPKCMLHNLHNVGKYQRGKRRQDIKRIWITEYYSTKQMDARNVLFVIGTNLSGPMGLDLIPVKGKQAAENLKKDYGGQAIIGLDQINQEIIDKVRKGRFR